MRQIRAVGQVVLVDVPDIGRVAILQRRGEFNCEKMKPESYPGACQVTAHGKVEDEETLEKARTREVGEELGIFIDSSAVTEIVRSESEEKLVVTYAMLAPKEILNQIRLEASSGGLRLLRETEIESIQNLYDFDEKQGVADRNIVAMFPDEKEAIRLAFEKLR